MDRLQELGREEREKTLVDLFLYSIIDPRFEVTIANCRLREQISLQECFEAIRKYDNIIIREELGDKNKIKIRRNGIKESNGDNIKQGSNTLKINTGNKSYKEWQKLSPEERTSIIKARENEQNKEHGKFNETSKRKVTFEGIHASGTSSNNNSPKKLRRIPTNQLDASDQENLQGTDEE
jgi:hypothetical protein